MLFSERLSEREMLEAKDANRETLLDNLLNDFRKAFPELTFELRLDFAIVNAQAIPLKDNRIVAIYGGLWLHPNIGAQGLTLFILHQAGHHLSKGCRAIINPLPPLACAADRRAV